MQPHRPPHLYEPNTIYFLTDKTIKGESYFETVEKKTLFLQVLKQALSKFSYRLYAFVIHDNHYHILVGVSDAQTLPAFINNLHSNSARLINKPDSTPGRAIWYQYWDRCIRTDRDFWFRFNYIHHNPVKHGYLKTQQEAEAYPWCSFKKWIEKMGKEWAYSVFEAYPSMDFTLEQED